MTVNCMRVLIVEDLPSDAELNEREVRRVCADCTFLRVDSREAYLDALESFKPELILSDYMMPRFDGMQALTIAQQRLPDVPFIIVTGSTNEDTAVACMKAGAWDYVIKEHVKRLASAVEGAMRARHLRREKVAQEQARVDSERRLFEAQRLGRLGYWRFEFATQTLFWSDVVYEIYGRDPALGPPSPAEEASYYSPADAERLRVTATEAWRAERRYEVEMTLVRPDGSPVRIVAIGNPLRDGDGHIIGMEGAVQDVTERWQAQRERERLLAAIEQTAEVVVVTNRDALIEYVNPAFEAVTGYRRDEVIGQNPRVMKSGVQDASFYRELWNTVTAGRTWHGRFVNKRRDGTLFTEEASISPVRDEMGEIVNYVAVKRDISDRLRWEEALQESERDLREAERLAHVGHWRWDCRGGVLDWSNEMQKMWGIDPERTQVELAEAIQTRLHPDDRAMFEEELAAAMRGRTPRVLTYRVVRPDGEVRTLLATPGEPKKDDDGVLLQLSGAVQDITDLRRAEEERSSLLAQLAHAQKMESVGRLAGGVAHDFNNMLGVIMARASLAQRALPPGHRVLSHLQEIEEAARRSTALTSQLLAFARKQVIMPRVLPLNETIENLLKMLRRLVGEDVLLEWKPQQELWPVLMDPGQVDQVLANLAVNARDAMPQGGTLTISTENVHAPAPAFETPHGPHAGEYVRIDVRDNGSGMDAETREHVFEPFFTTKETGKGTGLGLATVYGIVQQNKGWIDVETAPGRGTRFSIYLPCNREARPVPAEEPIAPLQRGNGTVLLVEDEASVLEVGELLLQELGYSVLIAKGGAEAIELASRHEGPIHLLMTDVVMPGLNGKAVSEAVAMLRPGIKVLFTSGYTADVIGTHGLLSPDIHFLEKPYQLESVAAAVREALLK